MKIQSLLTSAALALILAGPALAQDLDTLTAEELLPLAQEEGTVTVYAFTSRIARVETAFEEKYPGIDVIAHDMNSTTMIARIKAESTAGINNVDVVYISDAPVVFGELLASGLIGQYVPPRVADVLADEFKSPLLSQRLSTKVLMYNEAANPDGAPVDNLWALTEPDWSGRVLMVDPLQRGDYLDLMVEFVLQADAMAEAYEAHFGTPIVLDPGVDNAGVQFITDLFENDVVLLSSTDDVNAAIGSIDQANPPIGFTSYSDRRDNEDEGWALQVANEVEPSNGIIFPAILAVSSEAPNPAAARLLIDFLMGDDSDTGGAGFAPFYVPGDYATRSDIANHPDAVPLNEFIAWRIDPAATAEIRQEIADLILILQ